MFKCVNCGHVSKTKEKSYKVVIESKTKRYPYNEKTQSKATGTVGSEIVKEILVCKSCKDKYEQSRSST